MTRESQRPDVSVAHVVLETRAMADSLRFMLAIGMRSVFEGPTTSVLELRGGTHLLLFHSETADAREASFDLMVDDLTAMHRRLTELGYDPSPIAKRPHIGHHTFEVTEPSGARITFFSSHASGKPV